MHVCEQIFAFETFKVVRVRHRVLGIIHKILWVLVVLYYVLYVMIYQQKYMKYGRARVRVRVRLIRAICDLSRCVKARLARGIRDSECIAEWG